MTCGARAAPTRRAGGRVINTPILGDDGYVRWIINRAEDVTELVELRQGSRSRKADPYFSFPRKRGVSRDRRRRRQNGVARRCR